MFWVLDGGYSQYHALEIALGYVASGSNGRVNVSVASMFASDRQALGDFAALLKMGSC